MIKLEQNYRSTQTILTAANPVIERNKQRLPKTLNATQELGQGDKIRYYQSLRRRRRGLVSSPRRYRSTCGARPIGAAVLYRTNLSRACSKNRSGGAVSLITSSAASRFTSARKSKTSSPI